MPTFKTFAASATVMLALYAPRAVAQETQLQAFKAQPTIANTNGVVPGDPQNAIDDLRQIYQVLQQYKTRHQGQRPANLQALMQTLINDPKAYGFKDFDAARECLSNPDYLLRDANISPEEARITVNYTFNFQPNTTAGDVLAYTDVYVHDNIYSYDDGRAIPNRVGFYVVLRADGSIEKVPYDEALYFKSNSLARLNFFQTSADELLSSTTYSEQWRGMNSLGKPTPRFKSAARRG